MISFSDLVDLWVIKIKKAHDPLRTQYVEIKWTEHEMQIMQWKHVKGLFIVKIRRLYDYQTWLTNWQIVCKVNEVRKGLWDFVFLIVLFVCWLAGQANFNHMMGTQSWFVDQPHGWIKNDAVIF